ncbi:MAG: hypothetical protein ACRDJ3_05155 [Solirubrobacteraceae bacterium]
MIRGNTEASALISTTATIPKTTARSSMFTPLWQVKQCVHLDRTDIVAVSNGGDGLHTGQPVGLRPDDLML